MHIRKITKLPRKLVGRLSNVQMATVMEGGIGSELNWGQENPKLISSPMKNPPLGW